MGLKGEQELNWQRNGRSYSGGGDGTCEDTWDLKEPSGVWVKLEKFSETGTKVSRKKWWGIVNSTGTVFFGYLLK